MSIKLTIQYYHAHHDCQVGLGHQQSLRSGYSQSTWMAPPLRYVRRSLGGAYDATRRFVTNGSLAMFAIAQRVMTTF
jgi:hypothetical protein